MTKLTSPAPHGIDGLPFNSAQKPYNIFHRHKGKDWKWRIGDKERSQKTVAPIGGRIVAAYDDGGWHNDWGNYVDIVFNAAGDFVRLAHHATGTVRPREGQTISQDDPVGVMGETGKTNGVHLHEGLNIGGKWANPDAYRGPNGKHLPGTPVPAGSTSYKHTKVVLAPLNLRAKPKTGKVLVTIPAGTVVKTGKTAAGWTPVQYEKRTGWVSAEFAVLRSKKVGKKTLTLRDRPAPLKKAKVLQQLKAGTAVQVLEVEGKTSKATYWRVRVVKTGQTGWVVGEYLK